MQGDLQRVLGRNLRSFREAEGVSQEAFAQQHGYHRAFWGAVERGERNLSLQAVEKIAERLRIEPLLLLDGSSAPGDRVAADG
jgi:transcriptional regulator with XRE-family HTH domain